MIRLLPPRTNFISGPISNVATIMPIDSAFSAVIAAMINFGAGDYFYLTLVEGNTREEIKVTNRSGNNLTIVRAQGDTTALAFTSAAKYIVEVNKAAVEDIASDIVPVANFDITGTGLAVVSDLGGGNFSIDVPNLVLGGTSGVEVVGTWPSYAIGLTNDGNCCAEVVGVGGVVNIYGQGLANVTETLLGWQVAVATPTFNVIGGTMTGTWPNYTLTITGGGGTGTVTEVVVGTALVLTGDPNVNPTIDLANTAVTPGDYGGLVVDAQGRITAIPVTFNAVSVLVAGDGVNLTRTLDSVEIDIIAATEIAAGIVMLADADAPLNITDDTTAVSPKLLASVIADLEGTSVQGDATYSGEADGDYTVTLPTAAISLALLAGEKAVIFANTTARGAVLTDPVNYAIAVFSVTGGARIESNKKINQNEQSMVFVLDGPFTDGIALKHTALAGGESVPSYSLVALVL